MVRRYGHFNHAEDATQEALIAAATRWPQEGIPANPRGWLVTVSGRRLTDILRSEGSRQAREAKVARDASVADQVTVSDEAGDSSTDDTLVLLFMCCHPSLSAASQIALTLKAVGGLTSAEVARAFLVPEATMVRRISRAKVSIERSGIRFRLPEATERKERLDAVLHVLYLIFNEGYVATGGPLLVRIELCDEAIRLTRLLRNLTPDDGEVIGLLALMLLTDARRSARTALDGTVVPMAEQDRSRWKPDYIAEGVALISGTLGRFPTGPYQIQAAIAAIHDEASSPDLTDWPQIAALYEVLMSISDSPIVALNHAVAVAMARGPQAGLELIRELERDERLATSARLHAARAHLVERLGKESEARDAYLVAAGYSASLPLQRYLYAQAARLDGT